MQPLHTGLVLLTFLTLSFLASAAAAADSSAGLRRCGFPENWPDALEADTRSLRPCGPPETRTYRPKHRGIGYRALELESESCFVPDDAYRLLDEIIDETLRIVASDPEADRRQLSRYVQKLSGTTMDVMERRGFSIHIPTQTLGDALTPRSLPGENPPRYTLDCDTGSLVLLSVAEALKLKAHLVEMGISGEGTHNFVRWQVEDRKTLDWDTNGRGPCWIEGDLPGFEGKSLTEQQVTAYLLFLRGLQWARQDYVFRALQDYESAIHKFPEYTSSYNNFAWAVATKEFPERKALKQQALKHSRKLLELERSPNNLDTAACMAAYAGDFAAASKLEQEALDGKPWSAEFKRRLQQFNSTPPLDCSGDK